MKSNTPEVIVIGAGLAGLAAASDLAAAGARVHICEASDRVGGRLRTERVYLNGSPADPEASAFQLDRGFQVLLSAYPELRRRLDPAPLGLGRFAPGALVRANGRLHRVADPFRAPTALLGTLLAPVGTLKDKLRIAHMRSRVRSVDDPETLLLGDETTLDALRQRGFSPTMVDRFLRPLFGGVMLDVDLATPAGVLDFVFRMFAVGDAVLPNAGIEAVPRQLHAGLPTDRVQIHTGTTVDRIAEGPVLEIGPQRWSADAVIVATEGHAFSRLTGQPAPAGKPVLSIQYATPRPPISSPLIVLNGEGEGPILHLSVPSLVASGYAPQGWHLVHATVLGDAQNQADEHVQAEAEAQMRDWFGKDIDHWHLLRLQRIPYGQPAIPPPIRRIYQPERIQQGVYACGDHRAFGSQHAALRSGGLAARAVLDDWMQA